MKKITGIILSAAFLFSCNSKEEKGTFTVSGEIKNYSAKKIYLEQLFFDSREPLLVDSALLKDGKVSLRSKATEPGLYWLRLEGKQAGFLFINDQSKISFVIDSNSTSARGADFNTAANASARNFIKETDSIKSGINILYSNLRQLQQTGAGVNDSSIIAATSAFNEAKERLTVFSFKYADTAANPMVGLLAATAAPVEMEKFVLPLENLQKRFPEHAGVKGTVTFVKQKVNESKQQAQQQQPGGLQVGGMAPEITMADTDGKPFSLSSLRGKYVLVDFWASWCGPCRGENPNVVAAYKKFNNKNFTILGVSLDDNKQAWLNAIKQDGLEWKQVSDLKKWSSAAIPLYGIESIPYNVLVDPQGKIIAASLREEALHAKLDEVLK